MDIDYRICFICCFSENDTYAYHVDGRRFYINPDESLDYLDRGFNVMNTELIDFDKKLKICTHCMNELIKNEKNNL